VDARSDGFPKIMLHTAALLFCACINGSRPDQLRLFKVLTPDFVAKVSLVQQITETTRRGLCHHFRFYAGADFFPEICLSGKRVVFAEHVLERFSSRVANNLGEDLTNLLLCFFGGLVIALPVGPSRAFILEYADSILAFTYKESDTEYFITTCLTVKEMNSLKLEIPPQAFNLHYGTAFTQPKVRNWIPMDRMRKHYQRWQNRVELPAPAPRIDKKEWHRVCACLKDIETKAGHGPGSRMCFVDNIPGPCSLQIQPGHRELQYDELEMLNKVHPEYDWEGTIADRDVEARRMTPRPEE
jgi:hypothetical protein